MMTYYLKNISPRYTIPEVTEQQGNVIKTQIQVDGNNILN